jgi:hypothetical protein
MKICAHCKKRKAVFSGILPACLFCVNTGHKSGGSIADCPKCPQKPKPDGGERLVAFKPQNLKNAA